MNLNNTENTSIGCTVCECKHHTENDYCSLNHIKVVTSDSATNVCSQECTDCASFEAK